MKGQKITLIYQEKTAIDDRMGGFLEKWSSIKRIQGSLEVVESPERFHGDGRTVFATERFYCDFQVGISFKNTGRFVYKERIFDIVYFENAIEKDMFLVFTLKEIY